MIRFLATIGLALWFNSAVALGAAYEVVKDNNVKAQDNEVKALTFDAAEKPDQHAKGFILSKGWSKKVEFKDVKAQATLPRHFDWREQGKLTPIKNQGNCGSCWAHSTTATFQDVLALRGQGIVSLSEQYLLNCAKSVLGEDWSCNGGFFAHDMHKALPVGAVPYSEAPYLGRMDTCKTYSHPYHIASWAYLPSKDENTPPSNDSIKQAIYQYGPISVGIGANDAMSSYRSGIFNKCDGTAPNHAVNLVGWDEDGQYWIMRNSWSESWGEGGFGRIAYNCNQIGIAANYIVFNSPGPNPTPNPTPNPDPNPTPTPTPTPPPVPKCTPEPYADAGRDIRVYSGQPVLLGTPAKKGTSYHWESSAGKGRPLNSAQVVVRPYVSQIFTVYATTKCGTARDAVQVTVARNRR